MTATRSNGNSIDLHARLLFVSSELALWAACYGAYLVLRSVVIAGEGTAVANGLVLVAAERSLGVAHEAAVQDAAGPFAAVWAAYYMVGFAPVVAGALVWLGLRRPTLYRELRTRLLVSLVLALVVHAAFPAAPPRLVAELGLEDTVGLGGHDAGSFLGVPFNPYAAMPSMHVGWSLLVGLTLSRALPAGPARRCAIAHPLLMALAVTATGNHYFVDSLAGAAVALGVVALTARRPHRRLQARAVAAARLG